MKKILVILLGLSWLASCTEDLTSLNVDNKNPTTVPSFTLFSNAERNLARNMASTNVNTNIFRLLAQQWAQTTYIDESQYNLATRNIPQNWWHTMYRDVLKDLDEAKKIVKQADPVFTDPAQNQNQIAIISLLEAYTNMVLVTTFGNIPYSEALDITDVTPDYDDATVVYDSIVTQVDAALASMDEEAEGFGSADLIYGNSGDAVAHWKMFGNTLKLRLGMLIVDMNEARATTIIQEAAPGVFQSNADNATFQFLLSPPNTNPLWEDLVQSGRNDFVPANTLVNKMNALNDPRRQYYFTPLADGTYVGGVYGTNNSFSAYSHISDQIEAPDFPGVLLSYVESEFYLAEAAARGMTVEGTAAGHYNNAITASIQFWGGTEEEAAGYLAQPEVAYASAPGDFKQKIGEQKWIALYNRGFAAWTEWRRLDYPKLSAPANAVSEIPLRFTYPASEQTLNPTNYKEAASAIGGDKVTTRLFFDMQ